MVRTIFIICGWTNSIELVFYLQIHKLQFKMKKMQKYGIVFLLDFYLRMLHFLYTFCDKLEDRIRGKLSRRPIFYAFVGGLGVVLFWRGIWHSMDYLMEYFFVEFPWWDGPLSLVIGTSILLLSGVFVSTEIGNEVIISGLRGEKKTVDKTQDEIETEMYSLESIHKDLRYISNHLKKKQKKKVKKMNLSKSNQFSASPK